MHNLGYKCIKKYFENCIMYENNKINICLIVKYLRLFVFELKQNNKIVQ